MITLHKFLIPAAGIGMVVYFLWSPIVLLYLAILLAFILKPLHDSINSMINTSWLSALLCVSVFVTFLYLVLIFLLPALYTQVSMLVSTLGSLKMPVLLQNYFSNEDLTRYWQLLKKGLLKNMDYIGSYALQILSAQGMSVLVFLGKAYLVLIMAFYILKDWDRFHNILDQSLPEIYTKRVRKISADLVMFLKLWTQGQLMIVSCLIFYYCSAFYLSGIEHVLLFGIIAGSASLVPYIGMLASIVLTVLYTLNADPTAWALIKLALIFGFGNIMESGVLVPQLISRKLRMHPLSLLLYILFLGHLFGIYGVLLALPTAAVLQVFFIEFTNKAKQKWHSSNIESTSNVKRMIIKQSSDD